MIQPVATKFHPLTENSSQIPTLGQSRSHAETFWPALAIGFVFLLQFHLALTRSINRDEFHFLGQVHAFTRGELTLPMQTLHVRLFGWLPALGVEGVDQVRVARLFMLAAEAVTCAAIVTIARRFTALPYALMCALAYLSAGYVMQHGWSFRTDPIATALSLSALAIMARSRLNPTALAAFALLMGAAFMVTIKIILFAPAFAGIAWMRWCDTEKSMRRALHIAAAPIGAIIVAGALFAWHSLAIAPASDAAALVDRSGNSMFIAGGSPNLRYFLRAFVTAIPLFVALAALPSAMGKSETLSPPEKIALIGLAAMIATPLYYLNTFPYFYAFMLAPIAAALGAVLHALGKRYGVNLLLAVFAGWALMIWAIDKPSRLNEQRSIQIAASELFTEPVNYFDFPGFLPQHRKANHFLTGYGLENYKAGKKPKFTAIIAERTVPLLAAVDPEFNPSLLSTMEGLPNGFEFFPEDQKALQSTYRHVWGPLYVAGLELNAGETRQWHVWVPGTYTADAAITVGDNDFAKGDYVTLERGMIAVAAPDDSASGLIWGKDTKPPALPEPQRPLWTDF